MIAESNGVYKKEELEKIEVDVRTAADKIIAAKKATYYGIGIALTRLTKAILGDESSVQTVSVYLRGEYKQNGVFAVFRRLSTRAACSRLSAARLPMKSRKSSMHPARS